MHGVIVTVAILIEWYIAKKKAAIKVHTIRYL